MGKRNFIRKTRKCIIEITGLHISHNQYVEFIRAYTLSHTFNPFKLDYEKLVEFIFNRTDIPIK